MATARELIVNEPAQAVTSRRSLASWYTPGISDGLGDRLMMFDNTKAPSWELLRLRREFAAAPGFEAALRERIDELSAFVHPSFPSVRAVGDLRSEVGLALVSTFVTGQRLSEIVGRPRTDTFVMPVIRQLTSAVSALQQQGDAVAHGALSPDRVVLRADGHVAIREHVFGSALERLGLPAARLWTDLGIVAPASHAVPTLDRRSDVVQLALIALSLMLGRRVGPDEYPKQIAQLLEHVAGMDSRRSPRAFPRFRHWLEQALQVDGSVFESALDAEAALLDLTDEPHAAEHGPRLLVPRAQTRDRTQPAPVVPEPEVPVAPVVSGVNTAPAVNIAPDVTPVPPPEPVYSAPIPARVAQPESLDAFLPQSSIPSGFSESQAYRAGSTALAKTVSQSVVVSWKRPGPAFAPHPSEVPRPSALLWLTFVVALVGIAEGVIIGRLADMRSLSPWTAENAVVIESSQPGDVVMVDGRPLGVTPLELKVEAQTRSIRVYSRRTSTSADVKSAVSSRRQADAGSVDRPWTAAGSQRSGRVLLTSPIELDVFEGEQLLGSSTGGPIVAAAGRHEFLLLNTALGYSARRVVDIKPRQTVSLAVTPVDNTISINALPLAEAWKCGWTAIWSDRGRWDTFQSLWQGSTPCFVARNLVSEVR